MSETNYSVLILDDEDAVRMSLTDFFEDCDWNVFSAATGEKALEILKSGGIDGVVVDMRLPAMDGNTFIRKACEINSEAVFVVSTGSPEYHEPEDLEKLFRVSQTTFPKPIDDLEKLEEIMIEEIEKFRK